MWIMIEIIRKLELLYMQIHNNSITKEEMLQKIQNIKMDLM